jgi:hypothetical protein
MSTNISKINPNKTWIETVSINKQDRLILKIFKLSFIIFSFGTIYILAFSLDIKNKISSFFSKEEHIKPFKKHEQKTQTINTSEKIKEKKPSIINEKIDIENEEIDIENEDIINGDLSYQEIALKKLNDLKVLIIKDKKPILYAISFSFATYYFGTPVIVGAFTYLYLKKDQI